MALHTKASGAVKPLFGFPPPLVALLLIAVGLGIHFSFPALLLPDGWVQFVVAAPLIGVPVLMIYLHYGVISREERFLEERFGDEYRDYKRRVPRWIPALRV